MKRNIGYLMAAMMIFLAAMMIFSCGDDDDDDDPADSGTGDDDTEDDDDETDDDDDTADDDDDDSAFDPTLIIGKAYYLDIPLTAWTEPVGIGDIIGYYVPLILLGVQSAGAGAIEFIGTIGVDTEAKEIVQDECVVTTLLPDGTLGDDGAFETGPHDFQMRIFGLNATLYGMTCSGTFQSDGTGFTESVFAGLIDVRQVIEFFYFDADTICSMASTFGTDCVACPTDNEEYCVGIKAEGFQGKEVPGLTIEEIGPEDIGPECDEETDDDDADNAEGPLT